MIFHESRLLADESHKISYLVFCETADNTSRKSINEKRQNSMTCIKYVQLRASWTPETK